MSEPIPFAKIVRDELCIGAAFTLEIEIAIRDRLEKVLDGMEHPRKDDELSNVRLFAVNQCLHLAASVALAFSPPANLTKTREGLEEVAREAEVDATTLITVATLAYLLDNARTHADDQPQPRWPDKLWWCLQSVNWMVGETGVRALAIPTLKSKP